MVLATFEDSKKLKKHERADSARTFGLNNIFCFVILFEVKKLALFLLF